jgi:uncharacterized membrane protein
MSGLLLTMLYRIPHVASISMTFITISWFALAVFLIVLSIPLHQPWYRYVGLGIILLSLGRVAFIDMREQDTLLRVAVFAILGTGLLPISYGYFKWRAKIKNSQKES